eukprot:COSAG01_NODE_7893_length_3002_cov_5.993802_1_plen_141_part_00
MYPPPRRYPEGQGEGTADLLGRQLAPVAAVRKSQAPLSPRPAHFAVCGPLYFTHPPDVNIRYVRLLSLPSLFGRPAQPPWVSRVVERGWGLGDSVGPGVAYEAGVQVVLVIRSLHREAYFWCWSVGLLHSDEAVRRNAWG